MLLRVRLQIIAIVRMAITHLLCFFYGKNERIHRIPFGINAGKFLYTSPAISLRMFLGFDEELLARASQRLIKPGMVIYDIGAHIGYTSVLFASLTGSTGAVHSFELVPSTAAWLRKSVQANKFSFCVIHEVGVSDDSRTITLPVDKNRLAVVSQADARNIGAGAPEEVCRIVRLDDYAVENTLPDPQFVKMDIEHEEVKALRGMEKLIDRCHPVFVIEFHSAPLLRQGFEFLSKKGYRFLTLKQQPITQKSIEGLTHFWSNVICLPE